MTTFDEDAEDAMAIVNGDQQHPVIAEFEHVLADDDLFDAEFAALLRAETGAGRLPLTCASPEAHKREARRTKPLWWLRLAGLLDGKPDDDQPCPVCRLPWPKSHRRNG